MEGGIDSRPHIHVHACCWLVCCASPSASPAMPDVLCDTGVVPIALLCFLNTNCIDLQAGWSHAMDDVLLGEAAHELHVLRSRYLAKAKAACPVLLLLCQLKAYLCARVGVECQ